MPTRKDDRRDFPFETFSELVRKGGYSISDTQLSKLSGVPRTTIHRMCTNPKANPSWETVSRLFDALEYRIAVIPTEEADRTEGGKP